MNSEGPKDSTAFWDGAGQLAIAAALLFVAASFKHYGITWDEPLHLENGWRALDWYLSLGSDHRVLEFQNLYLYGALYDTVTAIATAILPFDAYESRRLVGGLVGVAALAAVREQARALAGPRAGALAAILLLLTPEWMGQAFANPKDIPFATAAAWIGLCQIRLLQELPRPKTGTLIGYGLALGAALGIRVGGVILILPLAAGWLYWLATRVGRDSRSEATLPLAGLSAGRLALAILLAWVVMVICWPWAQMAPLTRPFEALAGFSHFPLEFSFPFAGHTLVTTHLPWWYIPAAFGVKLPEVTLLGLAVVTAIGIRALIRRPRALSPATVGLAAAILLPPLLIVALGSVLYDGIRHLMFLIPSLTVAAAIGLDRLAGLLRQDRVTRHLPTATRLAGGFFAIWALLQVATMYRLHPYETIWYNRLVGGVKGAAGRFEMDYWGSALSEAADRLRNRIVAEEGSMSMAVPYRVRICGPQTSALYFLPPKWVSVGPDAPADFYISFTRGGCGPVPEGPEILRVSRMRVTLAYVLDLRPPHPVR